MEDYREMIDGDSEKRGLIWDECECETLVMKIYGYDGVFAWVCLHSTSISGLEDPTTLGL